MAKTVYGAEKYILIAPENCVTLPARIGGSAGTTIKAGTPLKGDLKARDTAFTAEATTPNVVLLHDVTIPTGATSANGTIITQGIVDMLKMDSATQALITATVVTALAGKVDFTRGAK